MKKNHITLELDEYLSKLDYFLMEGFSVTDASYPKLLKVGFSVDDEDIEYQFTVSNVKARAISKEFLSPTDYCTDRVRVTAHELNKTMTNYKPFDSSKISGAITKMVPKKSSGDKVKND